MKPGELDFEGIERRPLKVFTEKAYLDYSMYVILDRALPQLADGLKPVQRRIIYAMSELGLSAGSKHKKSARTVGDVIGKFHPHGDSACYEAMVHMAQDFSYRYAIVDGQGNWGSSDDAKSFAAMRYTEAKLRPYAETLLAELGQGTTEWLPNFDGTLEEPALLPARLPNVLLNGASGIAVRHGDRRAAAQPQGDRRRLRQADRRARCEPARPAQAGRRPRPADRRGDRHAEGGAAGTVRERQRQLPAPAPSTSKRTAKVIITALPYQVSGAKIQEQVAQQIRAKKLPMVDNVRDESDHEDPVRIVLELRSNRVDVEQLMAHLFATTDLERSYRVNLNVIALDGRPRVMGLKPLLIEWLSYRTQTITRRLEYRLGKLNARLHILEGLLIAFLNLDEVIRIVRREDEPKAVLIKRLKLSDEQAEAILETKLRHLAKLEEMKIRGEQAELAAERDDIQKTLKSPARLKKLMREELVADAEKYGDKRRTKLVEREAAKAIDETELVVAEPVTVVLSTAGWVRQAKGHEIDPRTLSYKTGDGYQAAAHGKSTQQAVFLDSTGRTYSLPAHGLPSARGQGEPLSGRVDPPEGATFASVMLGEPGERWVVATDFGYGFIVKLEELYARNRGGKAVLSVPDKAKAIPAAPVPEDAGALVAVAATAEGAGGRAAGVPGQRAAGAGQGPRQQAVQHPGRARRGTRGTGRRGRRARARRQAQGRVRRAHDDAQLGRARRLSRRARAARLDAAEDLSARDRARGRGARHLSAADTVARCRGYAAAARALAPRSEARRDAGGARR